MKKETYANKLNELLGITEVVEEVVKKNKQVGNQIEVSHDEIDSLRAMQGFLYYLEAPELFQHRQCKKCGDDYLVSRMHVAFCSYRCIRDSLADIGIEWSKGGDIEALVLDKQVYNGQEPIWIRNIPKVQYALSYLTEQFASLQQTSNQTSSGTDLQGQSSSSGLKVI